MCTIHDEEIDLAAYKELADARRRLGRFLDDVDNTKGIQSALGYLTPAEFEEPRANMERTEPPILSQQGPFPRPGFRARDRGTPSMNDAMECFMFNQRK